MGAVFKKELWLYFGTFLAYLIAGLFCILTSLFLFYFENEYNLLEIGTASMNPYFQMAPWFLVFLIPALTMRTIAEEEHQGTLQWIFSKPLFIYSFVLGKFFSIVVVILFTFLSAFTLLYTLKELAISDMDYGTIYSGFIGLVLISCVFIALGIFASSLSKNQIVAFLLGVFFCFIAYFGLEQLATYKFLGSFDYILQNIGLYYPFSSYVKGVVGLRETSYFILITALFIIGSVGIIEKKR